MASTHHPSSTTHSYYSLKSRSSPMVSTSQKIPSTTPISPIYQLFNPFNLIHPSIHRSSIRSWIPSRPSHLLTSHQKKLSNLLSNQHTTLLIIEPSITNNTKRSKSHPPHTPPKQHPLFKFQDPKSQIPKIPSSESYLPIYPIPSPPTNHTPPKQGNPYHISHTRIRISATLSFRF